MVCVLDGVNPLSMTLTGRWGQGRRHPLQQVPVLVKEDQVRRELEETNERNVALMIYFINCIHIDIFFSFKIAKTSLKLICLN